MHKGAAFALHSIQSLSRLFPIVSFLRSEYFLSVYHKLEQPGEKKTFSRRTFILSGKPYEALFGKTAYSDTK
ncbi:MAG: hypothetical protein MR966_15770 [Lachnospiraceae bacterium]|nr:hypothetical protein [Lachnospiraceae bacterium]